MRIFRNPRFSVFIKNRDHLPPHCHVRFKDGSEVCVTIPLAEPMYGATINEEVRDAVLDNLDALTDAWDKLHPIKHQRNNGNQNK